MTSLPRTTTAPVPFDTFGDLPYEPLRAGPPPGPRGVVVACVGARGGAGASVFAAALARTVTASGRSCLLVDGDPLGAGLDLLLGAEDAPGMRWPPFAMARGALPAGALAEGLPVVDGTRVLSWGRELPGPAASAWSAALPGVLAAGACEHDVVVLDLGRSAVLGESGPPAGIDLGLILVPAEVGATSAGAKLADVLRAAVPQVRVVVRGPSRGGLAAGPIGAVLGLPVLAEMAPEPGIADALERGDPPGLRGRGPLRRACRSVLAEVVRAQAAGVRS